MTIMRTFRLAATGGLAVAVLAGLALPAAADDAVKYKILKPYVERVRAVPGPNQHRYTYSTTTSHWSVVATESAPDVSVHLRLWDDAEQWDFLAGSLLWGGETNFVAVDSNHRPLDSYYASVQWKSGDGDYGVEFAQGDAVLDNHDQTIRVAASDVVLVRDTWLVAGETYTFSVDDPSEATLYLMGSRAGLSSTYVRSRSQALRSTEGGSSFTFATRISDWFGVVVTLPGDGGQVTLHRSGGGHDA